MAKGLSLHIGLNAVDPNGYGGWGGPLDGCENDAHSMNDIARKQGFTPKTLMTKQATSAAVIKEIKSAASKLASGDFFFLTYSGHGGQVPDTNGDEPDGLDETWCLYDRQLIDDELYGMWSQFKKGVRILMLSDSCHSGSMARAVIESGARIPIRGGGAIDSGAVRSKALPAEYERQAYEAQKKLYNSRQKKYAEGDNVKVQASVVLISGCQDNQTSADGAVNGLFTEKLLKVWNGGQFKGSLRDFHKMIVLQMPFSQTPNYFPVGVRSAKFEAAEPFTI